MDLAGLFTGGFWRNAIEAVASIIWALAKVIVFFLIIRFAAYRIIDRVLKTLVDRDSREPTFVTTGRIRTLGSLIKSIVFYVLVFIAGVMALRVFDIDPTPVLTAAGVVGLAVGFGAQRLVRDIISGFFIVLENQYSVGEYITVGAMTGTVQDFGMRVTQIRDDMGKLIIIANGDITIVTNHSRGPIQAVLDVSVAADSDISKVRAAIDRAGTEIVTEVKGALSPPRAHGMIAADASRITFRVIGEVEAGRHEVVQAALRERMRQIFSEEEIRMV